MLVWGGNERTSSMINTLVCLIRVWVSGPHIFPKSAAKVPSISVTCGHTEDREYVALITHPCTSVHHTQPMSGMWCPQDGMRRYQWKQ